MSGHQSPNSLMKIIFILSGKYKIFTFVYCVCKSYSTFKNPMVSNLLHKSMVEVFF